MKTQKISCKSILSESGIYSVDYSINPYIGCQHGCHYCYATYMKKFTNHQEPWGEFVDIKTNAPEQLTKDIRKARDGNQILLSSVTDPYQPIEKETELTRKILKKLKNTFYDINILTKGNLIQRDFDLIKEFGDKITVGFTINFLDESDREVWEPRASPIKERTRLIKKLSEVGVDTYVHVGPYLEDITDLEAIARELDSFVNEIQIENLNLQNQQRIKEIIRENYPELEQKYKKIIQNDGEYKKKLIEKTKELETNTKSNVSLFID